MQLGPAETQEQFHGSQISGIRFFIFIFLISQNGPNVVFCVYSLMILTSKWDTF